MWRHVLDGGEGLVNRHYVVVVVELDGLLLLLGSLGLAALLGHVHELLVLVAVGGAVGSALAAAAVADRLRPVEAVLAALEPA